MFCCGCCRRCAPGGGVAWHAHGAPGRPGRSCAVQRPGSESVAVAPKRALVKFCVLKKPRSDITADPGGHRPQRTGADTAWWTQRGGSHPGAVHVSWSTGTAGQVLLISSSHPMQMEPGWRCWAPRGAGRSDRGTAAHFPVQTAFASLGGLIHGLEGSGNFTDCMQPRRC